MPSETDMLCRIFPFDFQQTTCTDKHKLRNQVPVQDNHQHHCSNCGKLRNCIAHLKASERAVESFHKQSWLSKSLNQEHESHKLNCNVISWFQLRQNNQKHFLRHTYLLQPYFLLFLYLFFALFFISCSNATPLSKKRINISPLPDSNWTSNALFNQSNLHNRNISQISGSNSILKPSLNRVLLKTKRASEVTKRNVKKRRKNGKKSVNKRERPETKTRSGRGKKKIKINATPFPSELIRHERLRNSYKHGSSPRRQRLYNKNGISYHLAVWRNGSVSGEKSNKRSPYSLLEIRAISEGGVVSIMGVKTGKYICVSKKGIVRAKKRFKSKRCSFKERILQNHQNTYQSLSCSGCFLNLRKNGKIRRLKKSNPRLTQAHFLPRLSKKQFNRLQSKQGKILTITFPNDLQLSDDIVEEKLPLLALDEIPKKSLKPKRKTSKSKNFKRGKSQKSVQIQNRVP